jgi:SpoVK/Ycf46/Vps4 family AAA+-type ATPase
MFGARTDATEAGERYANMLTNFLLTRLEHHPGVVILTSNSRTRIDPAFLRRLDAIIEFPLPGPAERVELWNKHLGARSPGEEACCYLGSHCDLPGGAIRNAVLHAASLATPGAKLSFPSLVGALGREYRKLGRTLPASLVHAIQE